MSKQSLLKTNPYLKNPAERKEALFTSVSSSTAIEGVRISKAEISKAEKLINTKLNAYHKSVKSVG